MLCESMANSGRGYIYDCCCRIVEDVWRGNAIIVQPSLAPDAVAKARGNWSRGSTQYRSAVVEEYSATYSMAKSESAVSKHFSGPEWCQ